jgi:hypothetical protein
MLCGMKKIVDNSFLQDELSLRKFLSNSSRNVVVLSDYSTMETYRSGSIAAVYKVTKVLAEYPNQVEIIKGSTEIAGLSGRAAGLQRRLIDEDATDYFPSFCQDVAYALNGNVPSMNAFNRRIQAANEQLRIFLGHAEHIAYAYTEIAKVFTQDELKVIRTSDTYTPSITNKLTHLIAELAVPLIQTNPRDRRKLREEEFPNLLAFRLTICNIVLMLQWLSVGGALNTAPERLRNDIVDCLISAYATYFDGILTKDQKQNKIFNRVRYILRSGFGV